MLLQKKLHEPCDYIINLINPYTWW